MEVILQKLLMILNTVRLGGEVDEYELLTEIEDSRLRQIKNTAPILLF